MQPKQAVRHAESTQHGPNVWGPRVAQRLPWPRVALVKLASMLRVAQRLEKTSWPRLARVKLASMPRVAQQLEKMPWPRVARVKWAPSMPRVAQQLERMPGPRVVRQKNLQASYRWTTGREVPPDEQTLPKNQSPLVWVKRTQQTERKTPQRAHDGR